MSLATNQLGANRAPQISPIVIRQNGLLYVSECGLGSPYFTPLMLVERLESLPNTFQCADPRPVVV